MPPPPLFQPRATRGRAVRAGGRAGLCLLLLVSFPGRLPPSLPHAGSTAAPVSAGPLWPEHGAGAAPRGAALRPGTRRARVAAAARWTIPGDRRPRSDSPGSRWPPAPRLLCAGCLGGGGEGGVGSESLVFFPREGGSRSWAPAAGASRGREFQRDGAGCGRWGRVILGCVCAVTPSPSLLLRGARMAVGKLAPPSRANPWLPARLCGCVSHSPLPGASRVAAEIAQPSPLSILLTADVNKTTQKKTLTRPSRRFVPESLRS